MIPKRVDTLKQFTEWIKGYHNFSVVRFNDGEMTCANGTEGENCDGHPYSPELGELLKQSLDFFMSQDNVYLCDPIGGFAKMIVDIPMTDLFLFDVIRDTRYFFDPYLQRHPQFNNFIDGEGLHHRVNAMPVELREFVLAIKNSRQWKVYVGPERMSGLNGFLDCDVMVEIPEKNAFSEYERILEDFKYANNGHGIFIITAGMITKPLIMELIKHNPEGTYLDFGSSFDPMFYGQTRTGQPTMQEMKDFYNL